MSVCQNHKRKTDNQQIVGDMQCFLHYCYFFLLAHLSRTGELIV